MIFQQLKGGTVKQCKCQEKKFSREQKNVLNNRIIYFKNIYKVLSRVSGALWI